LLRRDAIKCDAPRAETKAFVDQVTLWPDGVFPAAMQAFFTSFARPATCARSAALIQKGLQ
jgi:hypothetical protein